MLVRLVRYRIPRKLHLPDPVYLYALLMGQVHLLEKNFRLSTQSRFFVNGRVLPC
jgi:hypothetical protein